MVYLHVHNIHTSYRYVTHPKIGYVRCTLWRPVKPLLNLTTCHYMIKWCINKFAIILCFYSQHRKYNYKHIRLHVYLLHILINLLAILWNLTIGEKIGNMHLVPGSCILLQHTKKLRKLSNRPIRIKKKSLLFFK